jgi:uncharacterized protein YodC (DUF2158 family)
MPNPGDTVRLKSGGPIMTVQHETMGGDWYCQWFDSKNELKQGTFSAEMLVLASTEPSVGSIPVRRG